jgi:hypothetical protein
VLLCSTVAKLLFQGHEYGTDNLVITDKSPACARLAAMMCAQSKPNLIAITGVTLLVRPQLPTARSQFVHVMTLRVNLAEHVVVEACQQSNARRHKPMAC